MKHNEKLFLEAVSNMFSDAAKLGLAYHGDTDERSHYVQYHWQSAEDMYRIKINNPKITHYEAISAAFFHTHSYKNIDDPSFDLAFRKQLTGSAVPPDQIDLALKYLDELRKELDMPVQHSGRRIDTFSNSAESATGSQNVEGLRQATNPTVGK